MVCTVTVDFCSLTDPPCTPASFPADFQSYCWQLPKLRTALVLHYSYLYFSLCSRNCCFSRKSTRAAPEGGKCCLYLLFRSLSYVLLILPLQGWACLRTLGACSLMPPSSGQLCIPTSVVKLWFCRGCVRLQIWSTNPGSTPLSASAAQGRLYLVLSTWKQITPDPN